MGVEDYNKQQLERLREHKIAFDQEAMWAAMQKKKKRRGALYFFTMALVALAIVFFTCFVFSRYFGENSRFNGENSRFSKEDSGHFEENISKTEVTTVEKSNPYNIINNNKKIKNDTAIVDKSNNTAMLDSNENKVSRKSTSDIANSNQGNQSIEDQKNEKPSLSNIINSKDTRASIKRKLANIYGSSSDESLNDTKNEQNSLSNEDERTSNLISTSENQRESKSNVSTKVSLDKLINIQPLKAHEFPYLESLSDNMVNLDKLEVNTFAIIEVIKEPKSRLNVGAYGGIGYLFRQSNLENTTELRPETLEEVSIGLELKYQLKPNLFVRSGVEYWHATESTETSTSSIINIKELEELPEGFTELDNGILITNSYSKFYTVYQSYNIPILFGWNTSNDTWNLFAEAGILYNFKTVRRQSESLTTSERDLFQIGSQNQISPIAGIGLSFSPSAKVELFARSNWRGSQFVTLKETDMSLKFGSIRTQLGVRIGI